MSSKKYTRQIFVWLHDIMIDHANVPPVTGLAVAFCMANEYFNDDGRPCFASCETIGKKIGASKPTVIATVRKLAAAGYLKVEWGKPGRGHSNRYWPILKGTSEHLLDTGKGKPGNLLDTGKGKFQKNKRSISDAEKVSHETRTTKENHYKRTRVESRARARETTHPGFQPINGKANGGEAAPHPQPIAADWQPSADDAAYASHKGLTQADIERAIERFRHYWADKGAKRVAGSPVCSLPPAINNNNKSGFSVIRKRFFDAILKTTGRGDASALSSQ